MPPLPGVLAMLSPTQSASKSYSSTVVATSESGITNASSYYSHFAKMCEENMSPNHNDDTTAAVSTSSPSSTSSSSMPSNSTATVMPSLNDNSTSSSNNTATLSATASSNGRDAESHNTITGTNQFDTDRVSPSCSTSSSDNISSSDNVENAKPTDVATAATKTADDCDTKNNENCRDLAPMSENGSNKKNSSSVTDVVDASDLNTSSSSSNMFGRPRKILLKNVNAHIMCSLCNGYLIDATTIVECLHSFCHSCIMNYLRKDQFCPRCEMMINTTKHNNIKLDTTLQAIVYKLVPGLYEKELLRKRAFYSTRPDEAKLASPEQRGDDTEHLIFGPADNMSLSLEYADMEELTNDDKATIELLKPKYLQCPANFTVSHLKKFVFGKFGIDHTRFTMDIMYKVKTIVLADHYKMMDVAYIYTWKRDAPMRFFFRVKQSERPLRRRQPLKSLPNLEANNQSENKAETETKIKVEIDEEMPENQEPLSADSMVTLPSAPLSSVEIKQEDEPVSPLAKPTPKVTETLKTSPKMTVDSPKIKSESPKIRSESPSGEQRTEKLKITLVNKDKRSKEHDDTPKSKSKNKSAKHSPCEPDERKVENIKLKIDLSKQGSVTIINMSSPETGKKEVVKSLKPEKEWKIKVKKDKERHSNGLNDKGKFEKTVPPITIELDKPKSPAPLAESPKPESDEDIKKSEFLNLIDLTPIKSIASLSPQKSPKTSAHNVGKSPLNSTMTPPTFNVKKPQMPPPPPVNNLKSTSSASKRKSKEPMKAVPKKPKLDLPPPKASSAQSQLKFRAYMAEPKTNKPGISFKLSPFPIGGETEKKSAETSAKSVSTSPSKETEADRKLEDEKLMPAPPPLRILEAFKKNGMKTPKGGATKQGKTTSKSNSSDGFLRPMVTTSMAQNSKVPIVSNVMGNRTPIARRYAPILPKQTKNPFASLAGGDAINSMPLTGDNGTSKTKPTTSASTTQTGGAVPQQKAAPTSKSGSNSNYLNYALFNSTKSKMGEVPLGCRTPIYTPNSPIYSPNSPQYMPNYNIPMQPTYKYTKQQSNATNYLQNILGSNQQMSGLFPGPPVKANNEQSTNKDNSPKPKSGQSSPEPMNNQTPVQSLLNSCNINIPSSLSITIRNEDDTENARKSANLKHSSPVNNYIEILKLPDVPAASNEMPKSNKPNTPPPSQSKSPAAAKAPDSKSVSQPTKSPTGMAGPSPLAKPPAHSPTTATKPKSSLLSDSSTEKQQRPSPVSTTAAGKHNATSPGKSRLNQKVISPEGSNAVSSVKKPLPAASPEGRNSDEAASSNMKKAQKRPAGEMSKSPKDKFDITPAALKKFRPILPRSKTPPLTGVPSSLPMNPIIPLSAQLPSATKAKAGRGRPKTAQKKKVDEYQFNGSSPIMSPLEAYIAWSKKSPKTLNGGQLDTPESGSLESTKTTKSPKPEKKKQKTSSSSEYKFNGCSPLLNPLEAYLQWTKPGKSPKGTKNQTETPEATKTKKSPKAFAEDASQRNATASTPPTVSSPMPLLGTPQSVVQNGSLPPELAAFLLQQQRHLQQQQQAQAVSFPPSGVINAPSFLPHLANFHPSPAVNLTMQRAFLMEQVARMQKAGAEALEKCMQQWPNNSSATQTKSPSGSPGSGSTSASSDTKN